MSRKSFPLIFCVLLLTIAARAQTAERHFKFHYAFTVQNVPVGQRVQIWIPLAHSDDFQEVRVVAAKGDLPLKKTLEKEFGNEMLYAFSKKADRAEYHFAVDYDVVRHERVASLGDASPQVQQVSARDQQLFLRPDKLVPITGLPAEIAARQVEGKTGDLPRARALYDYVLANMRYEKTGTGWGRGDVMYACDAKKGNCTDFHSLFISMARSQHIPARFEIGFPLPADKHSGDIAGYHCWADFWAARHGWVPVDISEAWKHQEKRDYFFGAHDVNRVQFTMGRDLTLSPPQNGDRLNYFVYPYAEVAGKPHSNVANDFSFADVQAAAALQGGK
jgi:transglutaminase-like putative cysteine protease